MHGARAAQGGAAAELGAGEAEQVAQRPEQRQPRIGEVVGELAGGAVDEDLHRASVVEAVAAELTFVGDDECADFEQSWQRMVAAALDRAASREFISALLKEQGITVP